MRVCIPHNIPEIQGGNILGYTSSRIRLINGLKEAGVVFDSDAKVAFHYCPPFVFQAVKGKFNVLFTMFENAWLSRSTRGAMEHADVIVVPSNWCKTVLRQYTKVPIHVVPLGVDTSLYQYRKRKIGRPFRFLWVGAPNTRKGWDLLIDVWQQTFARTNSCELYLKSTNVGCGILKERNMILDGRLVSDEELVAIYNDAHAFVFPTCAEGFGLSLAEALSTGLPSVVSKYSGVMDFTSPHTVRYCDVEDEWTRYGTVSDEYVQVRGKRAKLQDIADGMEWTIKNYDKALKMSRSASTWISKRLTWSHTALRLADVLGEYDEQPGEPAQQQEVNPNGCT